MLQSYSNLFLLFQVFVLLVYAVEEVHFLLVL